MNGIDTGQNKKGINLIPASLSVIFQKMKMCSFCRVREGEEAIGLNYLSSLGYFVCGKDKCKTLSHNYKYYIIRSVYSIGLPEPFSIRIYKSIGGEGGAMVPGLYHIDEGWIFSKIKKTTYMNIYNRICILVEKNNKQKEILVSDLLKWNINPGKKYIDKYTTKYNPDI